MAQDFDPSEHHEDTVLPDMADLVPHGAPIRMLDTLDAWRPGHASCTAVLRDDGPFAVDGQVDAVVALEIMAQAVAACLGYQAFRGGEGVRVGMIVGIRKMTLNRASFQVGERLTVVAECLRGDDTISRFQCETHIAGEAVATASMTVFHASEPPA